MERRRRNLYVEDELMARSKRAAALKGLSWSEYVRQAIALQVELDEQQKSTSKET